MNLDALEELVKHLPGQHDQSKHAGGRSGSGGASSKFSEKEGWKYDSLGMSWTKKVGDNEAIVREPNKKQFRDSYTVTLRHKGVQYVPMKGGAMLHPKEGSAKKVSDTFLSGKWKEPEFVDYSTYIKEYL